MDKRNLFFGLIFLGMVLASCSITYVVGSNFNDRQVEDIKIGVTDSTQVIKMFGEPFKKGKIDQFDVYIYNYEENEFPPSGTNIVHIDKRYKSLFIVFDEKAKVKHFTHNVPISLGSEFMIINHEQKRQQQQDDHINNMP